jgi:hypothetical protein
MVSYRGHGGLEFMNHERSKQEKPGIQSTPSITNIDLSRGDQQTAIEPSHQVTIHYKAMDRVPIPPPSLSRDDAGINIFCI